MFTYRCQIKIHISSAPISLVEFYKGHYNRPVVINCPFNTVVTLHYDEEGFYIIEWEQENKDINQARAKAFRILEYINSICSVGFMSNPISYSNLSVENKNEVEKADLQGFILPMELLESFNHSAKISNKLFENSKKVAYNKQLSNALYCYAEAIKYFYKYDYHKCMLELWKAVESVIGKTDKYCPIEQRVKGLQPKQIKVLLCLKRYRNDDNLAHGLSPKKWCYSLADIKIEDLVKQIKAVNKFLQLSIDILLEKGDKELLGLYKKYKKSRRYAKVPGTCFFRQKLTRTCFWIYSK